MFSLTRYNYSFLFAALLWTTVSFGQESVPAQIVRFPADLSNNHSAYDGVFSDGWVATSSCFWLRQPSGTFFKLKGLIPQVNDPAFSTQLEVLIDRRLIVTKILGCGEFTLEFAAADLASGKNDHRVELRYSQAQLLPSPDNRTVAARVYEVGFVEGAPTNPVSITSKSSVDIIAPVASGQIALGGGWYGLEKSATTPFRWVNNNAEIVLDIPSGKDAVILGMEVEPGPGVALKPFELLLFRESAKAPFEKITVRGRETVQIDLPFSPGTTEVITLKIEGGGQLTSQDTRTLNFRVFKLKLSEPVPQPVAASYAQKRSGMFDDGWVGKQVEFKIPQLSSPGVLVLRGSIPALSASENLTNEVTIKVDNKVIAREKLKQGAFEITTPPIPGGGIRKVELLFLNEFRLPNTDQRMVSALIEQVAFEKPPTDTKK